MWRKFFQKPCITSVVLNKKTPKKTSSAVWQSGIRPRRADLQLCIPPCDGLPFLYFPHYRAVVEKDHNTKEGLLTASSRESAASYGVADSLIFNWQNKIAHYFASPLNRRRRLVDSSPMTDSILPDDSLNHRRRCNYHLWQKIK